MSGIRKAVFFATSDQQVLLASNFIIAIVTSRLMPPGEVGIAVLGTAVVGLVTALREYAPSAYLIKPSDRPIRELQGALSAIIFANAVLLIGLALVAPLIGALYTDDRVTVYLRVFAAALMIEAFAMPVLAVLRAELEFAQAAAVSVASSSSTTPIRPGKKSSSPAVAAATSPTCIAARRTSSLLIRTSRNRLWRVTPLPTSSPW